jgi:single stranded DNA-binding protein
MLNMMFAGNVGGDVMLRDVTVRGENIKVASFSVAVNNGKNAQGEDLPPTWIKVSVWRKYVDIVAQYVKKGDRVTVTAENLKASAWHSKDGEVRSGLEVNAHRVDFSGNKRRSADEYTPPNTSDDIPF